MKYTSMLSKNISFSLYFFISLFLSPLFINGCIDKELKVEKAREKSKLLLGKIAEGTAINEFPEKYFSREQGEAILLDLREKCDFKNRKGVFVNDVISSQNGQRQASFIYEFMLKCDTIRLIFTYNLSPEIELYEFILEPIEKPNPMILKPENSLKFN